MRNSDADIHKAVAVFEDWSKTAAPDATTRMILHRFNMAHFALLSRIVETDAVDEKFRRHFQDVIAPAARQVLDD